MDITITSLMGNSQMLDGGAMFGNAPKAMWSQWITVDEHNRIPLCCRAMLIQENKRNILCETGIGAFFEPKFKSRYGVVESEHVLLSSLSAVGLSHEDIDVVILSHLHFDHAGGLLSAWQADREATLLFPKADYVVSQKAWERACAPHSRDRASFVPGLNTLLEASNRLVFIEADTHERLGPSFRFHHSDGHTPGLLLTEVQLPQTKVIFAADLIPGVPWVHLPITMGYDRFPEQLIDEKAKLLTYALQNHAKIFFTHDHQTALSGITRDEKNRFQAVELLPNCCRFTGC